MGSGETGTPVEGAGAGLAGGGGFLYRLIPNVSLDIDIGVQVADLSYVDAGGAGKSQGTTYIYLTGGARYHILGSGFWDPWVGAGGGYAHWSGAANPASASDSSYFGGALLRASAGLELWLSNYITVGARFDAHIPFWLNGSYSGGGSCSGDLCWIDPAAPVGTSAEQPLASGDLPFFWFAMINATFYFMNV